MTKQTDQNEQNEQRPRPRFGERQESDGNENKNGTSRFGGSSSGSSRFGGSASKDNPFAKSPASPPAPAPPVPSRFGNRFGSRQQLNWAILPINQTVARFELNGLGDPFYKLLGHDLKTELGDENAVAKILEEGGAHIDELEEKLNVVWEDYQLKGAVMVYRWNAKNWDSIATSEIFPARVNASRFGRASSDEEFTDDEVSLPEPTYTCLRALDLQLVLNVLARARTQVMLADAPLVFSQQYLTRSIVTDDPRLIDLVRATGFIQEKL